MSFERQAAAIIIIALLTTIIMVKTYQEGHYHHTLVIIIVMFTHQVGQLQESIDLLNRKLSEAEAAHQVLLYLKWF